MAIRHTAGGYWLEEAGSAEPRPALAADASADVLVVGGGYTGLWSAWYAEAARAAGAGDAVRVRDRGRGPERKKRRFLQRALVRAAGDARALWRRRREGDSGCSSRLRRCDRGLLRRAAGRRLVSPGRLSAGIDRSGLGRRLGGDDRCLRGARRRRRMQAAVARRGPRRAAIRRCFAVAPSIRERRPCNRRGSRAGCAGG